MRIVLAEKAWGEYLYWQKNDMQILKRINALIKDISRNPDDGLGKPEKLKHNLTGFCSRRINDEHRIVYRASENVVHIAQMRYHY